jgi:hypothetical protein
MAYDIGDQVDLEVYVYNDAGVLSSATVVLTVTLPDGTTSTPSVSTPSTGRYTASYTPAVAGTFYVKWAATAVGGVSGEDTVYEDSFTVSAASNAFISLDEAKSFLNITDTADDDELLAYLEWACTLAERIADTDFSRKTVTSEKHSVLRCTSSIVLDHRPVLSVTSLSESGTALSASDYTVDNRWGVVYRQAGSYQDTEWVQGRNNVTITYVTGWSIIPPEVRQATLQILEHLWENQRGGSPLAGGFRDVSEFPQAGANWNVPNKARDTLLSYTPPAIA